MTRMQSHMLQGGKRLHLNDGPIDLIIMADGTPAEMAVAYAAAEARFATILNELCDELPLLRQPAGRMPDGATARRMWRATIAFADEFFITPMATVAGSVAEEILGAMTSAASLARASVNNGGDIAIHLARGQSYRIGLVDRPDRPSLFAEAEIEFSDPVRGIATSGWRGRSFSLGIADAVTVLAKSASFADAAATIIANDVNLPGHPAITRVPACELQPDSDLGSLPVTRAVGFLRRDEIDSALARGVVKAAKLREQGVISACALHLAGCTRTVARPMRIAVHA